MWRDKNLGAYISFEGGGNSATVPTITPRGLQTNDKVAGTFTHTAVADAAWYLDPSTGLMTVVPTTNHIPRFEVGKYGQHAIRIDGAAANLIVEPSGPFDDGGADNWAATDITATVNTTETLDPSGANTADKLLTTAPGGDVTYLSRTAVGNNVAAAIWLKTNSGSEGGSLTLTGSTSGTSGAEAITITPEWQRFTITDDTSGYVGNIKFTVGIDDNATTVYAWSGNLYDSAEFDLGTVGALSTAVKTRGADKLTFPSVNIVNRDKLTVVMWLKPAFDPTAHSSSLVFFESGDSGGAAADSHVLFYFSGGAGDRLALEVRGDNANTKRIDYTPAVATGMTQDNQHNIGFTMDATVSNGGHIYVDGAELIAGSSNSDFNVSETGDTFSIGSKLDGTLQAFCAVDEIIITQDVKSASWFQQIYSRRYALGEGRNYWSSVRLANLNYVRQALRGGRSTIPLEFEEVKS